MSDSESEEESKIKPQKLENESSSDEERGAVGGEKPKTRGSRLADAGKSLKKAVIKGAGDLVKRISPSKSGHSPSPAQLPKRPSELVKPPDVRKGRPQSKSPREDSSSSKQTPQAGPSGLGSSTGLKRGRSASRSPPAGPSSSELSSEQGASRPIKSPAKRSITEKVKGMIEMEVIPDDEEAFVNEEIDTRAREAGVRSPQMSPVKVPTAIQLQNDREFAIWNFTKDFVSEIEVPKHRLKRVDTASEILSSPMGVCPPGDLEETAPPGEASGEAVTTADRRPDEAGGPEHVNEAFVPDDEDDVPEHKDEAGGPELVNEAFVPDDEVDVPEHKDEAP